MDGEANDAAPDIRAKLGAMVGNLGIQLNGEQLKMELRHGPWMSNL
jgi:hypothetical protein